MPFGSRPLLLSLTVVVAAGGSIGSGSHAETALSQTDPAAVAAAFAFLDSQMDLYHRATIVYSEPAFSAYYPSGRMGDAESDKDKYVTVDPDFRSDPHSGRSSLRIDYRPGPQGWAGLYFQYPDSNWGQFPGRQLSGATELTFWARADHETPMEFFVGGINHGVLRDTHRPNGDSLPKVTTDPSVVTVTPSWKRYTIKLQGNDLSSVIGGFGWATNRNQDAGPRSVFLDDIEFNLPKLNEPRFIQSYLPDDDCPDGGFANTAHTYDQALLLLALLARRNGDDLNRAELIARALVEAQHKDRTFQDGRLRNAYASGELIDPQSGATRIPGQYSYAEKKYLEDENAVGTDTGDMAWAALALVQAHQILPSRAGAPYLNAALALAKWIVTNTKVEDQFGGFTAGVAGFERKAGVPEGQIRKDYRATEHNIDLEALFEHLAAAVGSQTPEGAYWSTQAAHARVFVGKMWSGEHFWTGMDGKANINKSTVPLDVQAWSVLRSRDPGSDEKTALDWALKNCTAPDSSQAFGFRCNGSNGAWWEGTSQVAAALHWLGRDREAAAVLAGLQRAQLKDAPAAGAMPAASRCGLDTGFDMTFLTSGKTKPWRYSDWPHIGATAWFIFAELGVNPFFVAAVK